MKVLLGGVSTYAGETPLLQLVYSELSDKSLSPAQSPREQEPHFGSHSSPVAPWWVILLGSVTAGAF